MNNSSNSPVQASNPIPLAVWYTGTDKVRKGEAFCFDVSNVTGAAATLYNGLRHSYVTRPGTTNAGAFAGVASRDAYASATGTQIELYIPGSKGVEVALGVDTVLNTGILTFQVGGGNGAAGRFVKAGFPGRGSIVPRQTVTAVIEASMTGGWSVAVDGVTMTVSSTTGLTAGDTVILLGGEEESGGAKVIPGKYVIASITSPTVLVLTTAVSTATSSAALTCTGYAYTGNPTCQADLMEGDESGGVEFVSPPNVGTSTAMSYMVGGWSYICGGLTVGSAPANGPLAQGTVYGLRKAFAGLGTLTTNGATIDPATNGLQVDGDTALVLITINAAAEVIVLEWNCVWLCKGLVGATVAAT